MNPSIEKLANILAAIHACGYVPFYEDDESDIWDELPDVSNSKDEVDKKFFREMAAFSLSKIQQSKNPNEELSLILSRVHGHTLVPFYLKKIPKRSEDGTWDGYNWDLLPDKVKRRNEVDKVFFQNMAHQVLKEINS